MAYFLKVTTAAPEGCTNAVIMGRYVYHSLQVTGCANESTTQKHLVFNPEEISPSAQPDQRSHLFAASRGVSLVLETK